ncbi:MAG: hypothetical protein ACI9FO_000743, partial [Methylophagaceae bacterium]
MDSVVFDVTTYVDFPRFSRHNIMSKLKCGNENESVVVK